MFKRKADPAAELKRTLDATLATYKKLAQPERAAIRAVLDAVIDKMRMFEALAPDAERGVRKDTYALIGPEPTSGNLEKSPLAKIILGINN